MNVAQRVRLDREKHPELYCSKCLWKTGGGDCPKHMKGAGMVAVLGNDTAGPFSASDHLTPQAPVTNAGIPNEGTCFYCKGELGGRVKYRWDDHASCLKCFEDRVEEVMDKMDRKAHPIAHEFGGPL